MDSSLTCALSAQSDEVLSRFAQRMGAGQCWLVRGGRTQFLEALATRLKMPLVVSEILSLDPLSVTGPGSLRTDADVVTPAEPAISASSGDVPVLHAADITQISSVLCQPCSRGFDFAIEELDLLLPSNTAGLSVVGLSQKARPRAELCELFAALSQEESFAAFVWDMSLVAEYLENQEERMLKASDIAQELAHYLVCHPQVRGVRYPGLQSDPAYPCASGFFQRGFGTFIEYRSTQSSSWELFKSLDADCAPRDAAVCIEELEATLKT